MSVPEGYRFPEPNDLMRPFVCKRCGASVVGSAIDTHDAWHEKVDGQLDAIDSLTVVPVSTRGVVSGVTITGSEGAQVIGVVSDQVVRFGGDK